MNRFSGKVEHPHENFGEGNFSSLEVIDDGNGNVGVRGTDANGNSATAPAEMADNGAIKFKKSSFVWPLVLED